MKASLIVVSLSLCVVLLPASSGLRESAAPESLSVEGVMFGGGTGIYYKIVRAQYVDLSGNWWHVDTNCIIMNTSALFPITLKNIYVLGPNGITNILANYAGFVGTTIQPLGQFQFPIDSATIPGIIPQIAWADSGVRSVVVSWSGPSDAMKLTSVTEQWWPGSQTDRMHVRAEGHDLTQ